MYAIIEDGGKQYKVQPGDVLAVELRPVAQDTTHIEFDKVLFYQDEQTTAVGQPWIDGAKVVAKLNGPVSGTKLNAMQFRRRKDSQRRIGHRQKYLEVEITDITKP